METKASFIFLLLALLCIPIEVDKLFAQGDVSFIVTRDFPVGTEPRSVTVGDFNGDAIEDLATANGLFSGTVSILLGQGDGTLATANLAAQDLGVGDRPLSVTVGDFNGDRIQDLATANVNSDNVSILLNNTGATKLYFAQVGNGQGLTSEMVLTNPSATATVSGQVDFFDDDGLALSVGIVGVGGDVSSLEFSIPPRGEVTISTDGQGEVGTVGSAVVSADRVLGGVVRFQISGSGIAGVGASEPLGGFVVPVRRKAGGINTGIAIHNTQSTAVTLKLTLNTQGVPVSNGTATIENFPAAGHVAKFIDELFPDADTDDFQGTLVVEVIGGKVAATSLELGPEAGQFTSLPVTPLE